MNTVQLKNDLLEVDTMYSSRVIRNCSQFWSAYIAIKSERKFIDYFNEWRLKKETVFKTERLLVDQY